jgi:hypothetical protein
VTAGVGQERDGQRDDTGDHGSKRKAGDGGLPRLRPQAADRLPQRGKLFFKLLNGLKGAPRISTLLGSAWIGPLPP